MKKILLLSAMMLAITMLMAQHLVLEPGFKAGFNTSTFTSDNGVKYSPRLAYNVGVFTHIHLNSRFAVQPELVFSSQGARYSAFGVDYTSSFSYLNIPVMGQYMFGNGFRLQTGPQLGVLLDARQKEAGSDKMHVIGPDYKNLDFGWGLGVSYLSNMGLGADARVNMGLTNISTQIADNPPFTMRNQVVQLGLFYQFKPLVEPPRE